MTVGHCCVLWTPALQGLSISRMRAERQTSRCPPLPVSDQGLGRGQGLKWVLGHTQAQFVESRHWTPAGAGAMQVMLLAVALGGP